MRAIFISALLLLASSWATAQTPQPPIEAYGNLPTASALAISPTGEKIAYIRRDGDQNILAIINLETNDSWGVNINDLKVIDVEWAGTEHVILSGFDALRFNGNSRKYNYTAAFSVNVETRKLTTLLRNTDSLYANQTGIGEIIGRSVDDEYAFMPAYSRGSPQAPPYAVFRVDLDTGRGRVIEKGHKDAKDYIIAEDGTILAQERYSNRSNRYEIRTKRSGKWETIYDEISPSGPRGLVGILPDESALVFFSRADNGFNALYKMDFSGEISGAIMAREGVEINKVLTDNNRTVIGVEYGGLEPSYEFFDESLTADINDVKERAGTASVRLTSWTSDWTKLVLYIEGSDFAGDYLILDRTTGVLSSLAQSRPDIPRTAISEVLTIEYEARDGLTIPAILTIPRGAELQKLPLIVMPHGGPESHDQVGFDYMPQYFANRGYLVFQPNFRGSDGFGTEFTRAGYGGWGSTMQHDITDGVQALINGGQADPERVCIVGWSYGGYAALAGGAFTPDLYQCVASIAGVSHLPQILVDERRDHGRDHWVIQYWEAAMANGDATRDILKEKSPALYAENFEAPVLLIHGRDDVTVKINQSRIMRRELRRADKPVELIEYRGGDHSLLSPGDRLRALEELDAFITEHIGGQ
ncbi:MAG: alpha/beta fold hydrolase [Hyphomonadaceae bacterium]